MKPFKILSPCGMLGYGFPEESFRRGMEMHPDAIVVDAGSTDAGPHKLGLGTAIVSPQACKKDLTLMITAGAEAGIPVIIGSAGGSGARKHVLWTRRIIDEILEEHHLKDRKIATIWADIPKDRILASMEAGKVQPLGLAVKPLTPERLEKTTGVVAQMGHEPFMEALENGADIIIGGRAYDPSPFAAPAILHGCDPAYAYHLGKVLECAALCAMPGTTKDCMLGTIEEDGFIVTPLSPDRVCTPLSVAAHTFYEKDHPYILHGPGFTMDLSGCTFTECGNGAVRVTGSRLSWDAEYRIKLEGALQVAYRTFVLAGIRDELLLSRLREVEDLVVRQVQRYYREIDPDTYTIHFMNYGIDAVLGETEPNPTPGHEAGVMFEVLAPTQEMANMICATTRSTFLHYGYEGRKSTAGNLAFPFAPSDIPFGPVFEFSVYHLMQVPDGKCMFPIEYDTAGGER
ncbi:MAG: acyclic terpene utilization AtuA family protein [Clostridia bacterium]|nr:acyclic terpene utilization AtuA family protein [Clostridia bacterium]